VSFTIKSEKNQADFGNSPDIESGFITAMNKTPIVIAIVAILVLCLCSTCALAGTFYFLSQAGDGPSSRGQAPHEAVDENYADEDGDDQDFSNSPESEALRTTTTPGIAWAPTPTG
jgi:hypothetical protein